MSFLNPTMTAILIAFGIILVAPLVMAELFPIFKYVMLGFFCVAIYIFVRNIIGPGVLAFVISAILIYILVFKLWHLFAVTYMFYMLASFGLTGIIIFGLQSHDTPDRAKM